MCLVWPCRLGSGLEPFSFVKKKKKKKALLSAGCVEACEKNFGTYRPSIIWVTIFGLVLFGSALKLFDSSLKIRGPAVVN